MDVDGVRNAERLAFRYAAWLTEQLYQDEGIYQHGPTTMGEAWSKHIKRNGRGHIIYGRKGLEACFRSGFKEYQCLQQIVRDRPNWGFAGVTMLVCHEFAHVLQTATPGGRIWGSVHNEIFADHYVRLLNAFSAATRIEAWIATQGITGDEARLARKAQDPRPRMIEPRLTFVARPMPAAAQRPTRQPRWFDEPE